MKKEIRQLNDGEVTQALDLCWDVFCECSAKDCTAEGREEFWRSLDHEYMISRMGDGAVRAWGAFADGRLCGVCFIKEPCCVELLFVEKESQGKKIGTSLLKRAVMDARRADETVMRVTVNALKSAYGFFEKQGFKPLGAEEDYDGVPRKLMEIRGVIEIIV